MKIINKLYFGLLLFPTIAFSADEMGVDSLLEHARRSGDLSRQILKLIFGEVVENPLSFSEDGGY